MIFAYGSGDHKSREKTDIGATLSAEVTGANDEHIQTDAVAGFFPSSR